MDEGFEDRFGEALKREVDAVDVSTPDSAGLMAATGRSGRGARVLTIAASLVVLAVLAAVVVTSRPESAVLIEGGEAGFVPATMEDLAGRTFLSVSDLVGAPIPNAFLTLGFATTEEVAGRTDYDNVGLAFGSTPGCNSSSASPVLDSDGVMSVTSVFSTLMGCGDPLEAQEEWTSSVIASSPQLLLRTDRLVLVTDDVRIEFAELRPATAEVLALRTFVSVGDLPGAPIPDASITMSFSANAAVPDMLIVRFDSDPGCNGKGAKAQLDADGRLSADVIDRTDVGCTETIERQDQWIVDFVESNPRLLISGNRLTVVGTSFDIILTDQPNGLNTGPSTLPIPPICEEVAQVIADTMLDVTAETDLSILYDNPAEAFNDQQQAAVSGALADATSTAECPEQQIRRRAVELLYEGAFERFDTDELNARQTILSGLLIALVPQDFGLGQTPDPVETITVPGRTVTEPMATQTPDAPTPTTTPGQALAIGPTPVPVAGPQTGWCEATGLVGAAVLTSGQLTALCADGSRVPVDDATDWTSVDIGGQRLVAERVNREGFEFVEYDSQGAQGAMPGRRPDASLTESLTWLDDDDAVRIDTFRGSTWVPPQAVDALSWDRDGRWIFARARDHIGVFAWDTLHQDRPDPVPAITNIPVPGLLAMAGEVDTPNNVVVLTNRGDQLRIEATFVGQPDSPKLFGLASVDLDPTLFTADSSFIEPVSLRGYDPNATTPWAGGNEIGWVIGDGTSAWYVNGSSPPVLIGSDLKDVALIPSG